MQPRQCAIVAAAALAALFHTTAASAEPAPQPFRWGGLGYGFEGPILLGGSLLEQELLEPLALGTGYAAPSWGGSFGGGGGVLLGDQLWIGGQGHGTIAPSSSTTRGSARTSFGGGGFELGFAAVNNGLWLVTPFVGIGGLGYDVSVRSTVPGMRVGARDVPVGQTIEFKGGSATLGLGARGHRLLFWDNAGITVGWELGALFSMASSTWEVDGQSAQAGRPSLQGLYLRVLVGGGGFWHKK
jgi:hypothetical protein